MKDRADNEVFLFNILEELYSLNHRQWKKRIMLVLMAHDEAQYGQIKDQLTEIPDLLVYRCIRELIMEGMILKHSVEGRTCYCFTREGRTLAPVLADVEK